MARWHILIVNQHGDNRGDEAAMRAMIEAFEDRLGDVRFTILHQFRDRGLRPKLDANVEWYSLVLSPVTGILMLLAALLRPWGLGKDPQGNSELAQLRRAYESCDLVVSAPGGPYFGDIYASHEIVHWFYVWLARRYGKPCMLYATSVGPFRNPWLNPVRRIMFRSFEKLCVRENVSAELLDGLLPGIECIVTADSALQRRPYPPKEAARNSSFLLGVSVRQHGFPNAANEKERERLQQHYFEVVEQAIRHLVKLGADRVILFPQLYGSKHSDVEFLEEVSNRVRDVITCEIFDPDATSEEQREAVRLCDLFIASRYHPQIFAASAGVPGICIAYEHKMTGFMDQMQLSHYSFPIDDIDCANVLAALDEIYDNRFVLSAKLIASSARLHEESRKTTSIAVSLLPCGLKKETV